MDSTQAPVSRHVALANELLGEIAMARYPVGSRYPTEQELQGRFGVGRHTIREALKILAEQGLLGRRRKTGTIVLAHRPVSHYVHTLRDLRGLFDFAQATHLRIEHAGYLSNPRSVRDVYPDLAEGRWYRIAGLRSRKPGNEPLCWSEILVPERLVPSREAVHRGDRAVYEIVMQEHGLRLDHVEQEITASELQGGFAMRLAARPQTAALLVRRRYVDQSGTTFEISHNLYPADRYSVRSIIRKRP